MGDDNSELDMRVIEKFAEYVEAFTKTTNIEVKKFDDEVGEIMNIDLGALKEKGADQLNLWAFRLTSFSFYLQSQLNDAISKRDWCNEVMNHLVASSYDRSLYANYEVRRKMCAIAENNTFGTKVEKIHTYMQARVTLLSDKVADVRRMADTLNQMAKRRDYS